MHTAVMNHVMLPVICFLAAMRVETGEMETNASTLLFLVAILVFLIRISYCVLYISYGKAPIARWLPSLLLHRWGFYYYRYAISAETGDIKVSRRLHVCTLYVLRKQSQLLLTAF